MSATDDFWKAVDEYADARRGFGGEGPETMHFAKMRLQSAMWAVTAEQSRRIENIVTAAAPMLVTGDYAPFDAAKRGRALVDAIIADEAVRLGIEPAQ